MAAPTNLIEALVAALAADSRVTALATGGVYSGDAPDGTALPYAVLSRAEDRPQGIIGANQWVDSITVSFEFFAATGAAAQQIGEQVRDIAMMPRAPLRWAGYLSGVESGRYLPGGESLALEEQFGPGGTDVWIYIIPIVYITARG